MVHDLIQRDEEDAAEQAPRRDRIEGAPVYRLTDEVEGEGRKEGAGAERHERRHHARSWCPAEGGERTERQRGRADQSKDECLGGDTFEAGHR